MLHYNVLLNAVKLGIFRRYWLLCYHPSIEATQQSAHSIAAIVGGWSACVINHTDLQINFVMCRLCAMYRLVQKQTLVVSTVL